MERTPVAGRLVTWALIVLGAGEVFWVVYLAFTQTQVVRIMHVRLATLGLGGFALALCLAAVVALRRRSALAPVVCVAAATTLTFLAAFGRLTPALDTSGLLGTAQRPLLVVLPGVVAAVWVATMLLRAGGAGGPWPDPAAWRSTVVPVAIAVLGLTAAVVAVRLVSHVLTWDSTALATQSRAIVVILDTGETVGLLGSGVASLLGHVRLTAVLATVAGSLLVCDAYGNVVMAGSGQAFTAALFYLVVGELPSILLCVLAVRAAQRRLTRAAQELTLPA